MLIGSLICLRGGLLGEYLGMSDRRTACVKIKDRIELVDLDEISRPRGRPPQFRAGDPVTVELETVRGGATVVVPLLAEVVGMDGSHPLVKVTERDPIWFGCELNGRRWKVKKAVA